MRSASAIFLILFAIMAVKAVPTKENKKVIRVPFREVRVKDSKLRRANNATGLVRRATGYVPVNSFDNLFWLGNMSLGTPPQTFQVLFDTAAPQTWVADATCGDPCKAVPMYNGGASSTYHDNAQHADIKYSDGTTISGTWTTDVLTLTDQVHVQQEFVRANVVPDGYISSGISGLVGLSFGLPNDVPSIIDSLMSQKALDRNVLSCRFIKDQEGTGEGLGDLLFGDVELEYVDGDVQYTSIAKTKDNSHWWIIPFDDIQIGGQSVAQPTYAVIDTAAGVNVVTDAVAKNLYAGIEGAEQGSDGYWIAPMPFPSDVNFVIRDRTFTIPASDMLTDTQIGDKYITTIQGGGQTDPFDLWVFGSPFIKNQYLVFDFDGLSIGIGKRNDY